MTCEYICKDQQDSLSLPSICAPRAVSIFGDTRRRIRRKGSMEETKEDVILDS